LGRLTADEVKAWIERRKAEIEKGPEKDKEGDK